MATIPKKYRTFLEIKYPEVLKELDIYAAPAQPKGMIPAKKTEVESGACVEVLKPANGDKLLRSIGEKFGDKPFTEKEFIQHAMSFLKEEAKTT